MTLRQLRCEAIVIHFATRFEDTIEECIKVEEGLITGELTGCYKRIINEQNNRIKVCMFCFNIIKGISDKGYLDIYSGWLDDKWDKMNARINFLFN